MRLSQILQQTIIRVCWNLSPYWHDTQWNRSDRACQWWTRGPSAGLGIQRPFRPKIRDETKTSETNNQREVFCLFFYSQLTERKDWDVFIACVYGLVLSPLSLSSWQWFIHSLCTLSLSLSRPPPFLPHISPFLYPAGKKKKKTIIKDQMYK